jgi:norsolorinic acid ketoreductase
VIATVRDPSRDTSKAISSLPVASNTKLIIIKINSANEQDAAAAIVEVQSQGVNYLDAVMANAGIGRDMEPPVTVSISTMHLHFEVNTLGPLSLFQVCWPLLEKSEKPKFVTISGSVSSIRNMEQEHLPLTAYGCSKAAVNHITRQMHVRYPSLIAFPVHPG